MKKFIICLLFLFIVSCNSNSVFKNINKIKESFETNISIYVTPIEGEYIIVDSEKDIWFIKFPIIIGIENPNMEFKEKIIPNTNIIGELVKKFDNE